LFRVDTGKKQQILWLYSELRQLLSRHPRAALLITFNLRKWGRDGRRPNLLTNPREWLEEVCFLFLNRNGRPYAANKVVEYGLWPVLDKLGIERAGMHAFRHCHASLLIDVGANPKVAQEQMRHSDAQITLQIYGHVIGGAQREAVDKVGELLPPDAKFCAPMRPN
jgi:integrase